MDSISIATAKQIREMLGATHLVIFATGDDKVQHVATHGETRQQAKEAADLGNQLKETLGWPEHMCKATPVERRCGNCAYWKKDYGTYCFNGWTGDGSEGYCQYEIKRVKTGIKDFCHHFEPK